MWKDCVIHPNKPRPPGGYAFVRRDGSKSIGRGKMSKAPRAQAVDALICTRCGTTITLGRDVRFVDGLAHRPVHKKKNYCDERWMWRLGSELANIRTALEVVPSAKKILDDLKTVLYI